MRKNRQEKVPRSISGPNIMNSDFRSRCFRWELGDKSVLVGKTFYVIQPSMDYRDYFFKVRDIKFGPVEGGGLKIHCWYHLIYDPEGGYIYRNSHIDCGHIDEWYLLNDVENHRFEEIICNSVGLSNPIPSLVTRYY